jgi:hypothetical protein
MLALPIGFLIVYVCGRFFRWILKPLDIPSASVAEFKRERTLSYVIFASMLLTSVGVLILGVTYLVGIVRHIRRQVRNAGAANPDASPRVIPSFSLSELMAMVFSIGLAPVLLQTLTDETNKELAFWGLIVAIAVFPACFLCALYRLEFNRVPSGTHRLLLLAITPYLALSTASIPVAPFVLFIYLQFLRPQKSVPPQLIAWMVVMCLVIAVARLLAGQAAEAAHAARAEREAQTARASALAQSDSVV